MIGLQEVNFSSSSSHSFSLTGIASSKWMHLSSVTGIMSSGSMLMSSSVSASLAAAGGPTATAQSPAAAATAGFQALSYAAAAAAGNAAAVCVPVNSTGFSNSSSSSSAAMSMNWLSGLGTHQTWQKAGSLVQQQQEGASVRLKTSRKLLLLLNPALSHSPQHQDLPKPRSSNNLTPGSKPWLTWQPAPLNPDMVLFLKGLAVISGVNTLATLARAFTFAAAGMAAARVVHERLLAAVLDAPLAVFDRQPAGRLLNR
jgi:hypothetical protein